MVCVLINAILWLTVLCLCCIDAVAFLGPASPTARPKPTYKHPQLFTKIELSKRSVIHAANSGRGEMKLPKVIIFDLDGCLWTPEMYEIMYFMGGMGSPFTKDPRGNGSLLTCGNASVKLLGDVQAVFQDLYLQPMFKDILVGISSRTDRPDWARELLEKFEVTEGEKGEPVYLVDVMSGPIEIEKDSKVDHFRRIHEETAISYSDMLFFDNEFGNCEKVASLGVSVVFCPNGVTREVWNMGVFEDFPRIDGTVINSSQRGWY